MYYDTPMRCLQVYYPFRLWILRSWSNFFAQMKNIPLSSTDPNSELCTKSSKTMVSEQTHSNWLVGFSFCTSSNMVPTSAYTYSLWVFLSCAKINFYSLWTNLQGYKIIQQNANVSSVLGAVTEYAYEENSWVPINVQLFGFYRITGPKL